MLEPLRRVRVRPDRYQGAMGLRDAAGLPVDIQPMRIGVELHGHADAGRFRDDGIKVDGVRLSREQQSPSRVTENSEMRIIECSEHAVGHLPGIHTVARMHGADHKVEAIEKCRVVVQSAAGQDVCLNPLEQLKIRAVCRVARVQRINLLMLPQNVIARQTARMRIGLRVIRDAEVAQSAGARGLGHGFHARPTVTVQRMAM